MLDVNTEDFTGSQPQEAKNDSRNESITEFYLNIQKKPDGGKIKKHYDQTSLVH